MRTSVDLLRIPWNPAGTGAVEELQKLAGIDSERLELLRHKHPSL